MTSPTIETDLGKILDKIDRNLNSLQAELTDFRTEQKEAVAEIKGDIKALDERLTGQIKALDERLTGQVKSLDNLREDVRATNGRFWSLVAFLGTGLLGGLGAAIGLLIKVFVFPSPAP